MKKALFILLVTTSLFLMNYAFADIITTSDGRTIDGKIVGEEGPNFRIEVAQGFVFIPKSSVVEIVAQKTVKETYAERLEQTDSADAAALYELARWCKENKLNKYYKELLEKTLIADADFEPARRALGYVKYEDEWVTKDEMMIRMGYVKYQDKWYPAEVVAELIKIEQTKEFLKERKAENAKREKLYEKSRQATYDMAMKARRSLVYSEQPGQKNVRSASFESSYNFDDGSGFTVKSSSFSDTSIERPVNYNTYNIYPTNRTTTYVSYDAELPEPAKNAVLKDELPKSPPMNNKAPRPVARDDSGKGPAVKQAAAKDDKGHGNDAGHTDEDNPGKGVGNHGTKQQPAGRSDSVKQGVPGPKTGITNRENGNENKNDNKGHGNNADRDDEDNPGQGQGAHGAQPDVNNDGTDDDEKSNNGESNQSDTKQSQDTVGSDSANGKENASNQGNNSDNGSKGNDNGNKDKKDENKGKK